MRSFLSICHGDGLEDVRRNQSAWAKLGLRLGLQLVRPSTPLCLLSGLTYVPCWSMGSKESQDPRERSDLEQTYIALKKEEKRITHLGSWLYVEPHADYGNDYGLLGWNISKILGKDFRNSGSTALFKSVLEYEMNVPVRQIQNSLNISTLTWNKRFFPFKHMLKPASEFLH